MRFFSIILDNKNEDLSDLEKICEETNGLLIHDKNGDEYILDLLNPILDYFTRGIKITMPIWSKIYNDAFGFGLLTTVTMPAYKGDKLIGVTAIDVPVDYLKSNFFFTERELESLLL